MGGCGGGGWMLEEEEAEVADWVAIDDAGEDVVDRRFFGWAVSYIIHMTTIAFLFFFLLAADDFMTLLHR